MVADTEAEGPGRRFALWVQGCPLRCPGCCNPELFSPDGGTLVSVVDLGAQIAATPGIEGVSILGGEPFAQAPELAQLGRTMRDRGLSVMIYSGYTLAELHAMGPDAAALLATCDLLVDGRYDRERPETRRRWIGSANQVMHFLTNRYRADDSRFFAPNTFELRLADGALFVNGWPAPAHALLGRTRR
jgi:anaerobic ribonucleoside-triphosphate reductase activating protein